MDGSCSDKGVKPSLCDNDRKKYNYKWEILGQARPEGKAKGFSKSKHSPLSDNAEDPSSLLDVLTGARARSSPGDLAASEAKALASTSEDELWATKEKPQREDFLK